MFRRIFRRLRTLTHSQRVDRDIRRELDFHVESSA